MARDTKQINFGLHQMTVRDYFSGVPVFACEVVGDLSLPVSGEIEDLVGGDSPWATAGEPKSIKVEGSIELRECPEELAEVLAAGVGAKTAASATGTVDTLANYKGTSVMSATTGIASVGKKTGEVLEMKAGQYIVYAVSGTTVDVYATTSVDLKKGTALTIQDDSLKITATALTISTGSAVEIPDTGVELTGGSGTIGMTVGDTAYFEIWPPHNGVEVITLGAAANTFKRVALTFAASKRTTGEIGYVECPNAIALGVPFGFKEKGWSSGSVMIRAYRHETKDFAMKFTNIKATSV